MHSFLSGIRRLPARQGRRPLTAAGLALCVLTGVLLGGAPASADPPVLTGAAGPCKITQQSLPDPTKSGFRVTVLSPTGTADTPLMGGQCGDARRPVVVFVHGFLATLPVLYQGLIQHLASTGNIVIYAPWHTANQNFAAEYGGELASVTAIVATLPRADTSRVGMVGHSLGGGMMPYMAQTLAAQGWGQQAFWVGVLAPDATQAMGTGALPLPSNARVLVVAFDHDITVDNRLGIDQFDSYAIPAAQKQYVLVRSDQHNGQSLVAGHLVPNGLPAPSVLQQYGVFRNLDATETCATLGNCATDLTYMGTWPDGTPVMPALVEAQPVDTGPRATIECQAPGNPRRANCGPSSLPSGL